MAGSPSIGPLVAGELVEVAAIGHFTELGESTKADQPLADFAESLIDSVLLGLSAKQFGGRRQSLLVYRDRRLEHCHLEIRLDRDAHEGAAADDVDVDARDVAAHDPGAANQQEMARVASDSIACVRHEPAGDHAPLARS